MSNDWVEELYERLEELKFETVKEDWEMSDAWNILDNNERTLVKGGFNQAVRECMDVIEEVFRIHVNEEIERLEKDIERAGKDIEEQHREGEITTSKAEALKRELGECRRHLEAKKGQMQILNEVHEGER